MDSIYENSDVILSAVASDENYSKSKGNSTEEQEREVSSPKSTKVLLTLLGFSLVFALGGLCTVLILYNNKLGDFESVNEQNIVVSKKLAAQEINSTALKKEFNDLTSRYNTLREWLSLYDACNLSVDGWIAFRGKLYLFSSDKLNRWRSRDVCVSKGADLVTITSRSEQDFLVSKMKGWYWIGLNDLDTEGHWVWVNNQTLKDTGVQFWHQRTSQKSEPDNWKEEDVTGENCAIMKHDVTHPNNWFDVSCNYQMRFICEKKLTYLHQ